MTPFAPDSSELNIEQEWVNYYTRENPFEAIPIDRKQFEREEITREWAPTRFVEVVHGLLVREVRDKVHLVLQYRSPDKMFNGWLLDKTFWWHCSVGKGRNLSLEIEARQELWMPLNICYNFHEALVYYMALKKDLNKSWIWYIADTFDFISHRKLRDGKMITVGNRVHFAPFLYHWPTEFPDGEASWTQMVALDDVLSDIQSWTHERREKYTNDLRFLVSHFTPEIEKMAHILKSSVLPLHDWK